VQLAAGAVVGMGGGGASGNAKAIATLDNGEKFHLFVKTCRPGSQEAIWNELLGIFDNERNFYSIIWPKLLAEIPDHPAKDHLPLYLGTGNVGQEIHLIFEDFSAAFGHAPPAHDEYLDVEDTKKCMKALGAYHALSRSSGNWQTVLAHAHLLQDWVIRAEKSTEITPMFCGRGAKTLSLLKRVLEYITEEKSTISLGLKVPESVTPESLSRLQEFTAKFLTLLRVTRAPSESQFDILLHGDYHMWNVALSKGQKPKMFDFQDVSYGPFACDLQQFLSQTAKTPVRIEHLSSFLDAYKDGFSSSCNDKDVLERWTKENIKKEYARQAPVGLIFGLNFVPTRFIAQEKLDLAIEETTSLEECVKLLDSTALDTVQDMFTLVDEYLSFGVIETIEELLNRA